VFELQRLNRAVFLSCGKKQKQFKCFFIRFKGMRASAFYLGQIIAEEPVNIFREVHSSSRWEMVKSTRLLC
jgi:hypothetical protein